MVIRMSARVKSTTLASNDFLIIAIVLVIVGLGVVVWTASVGELYSFARYSTTLFIIAFVFLGFSSVERYRKRHSDQYKESKFEQEKQTTQQKTHCI